MLEADDFDPENGDYVITNKAYDSQLDRVSQYGRVLFDCWPEALNAMIRDHAERAQFWPNIWRVSDHGNVSQIIGVYDDTNADPNRIVYGGSIGWRDCDPLMSVIGFDASAVDAKLDELETEERDRANDQWIPETCADCERDACEHTDDCDCDDPDIDDLVNYGSSAFKLAEMIRDILPSGSDGREKIAELMSEGLTIT